MKEEVRNMECYCEEVIICNKETRGVGVEGNPIRVITQVYSKIGNLIAEYDCWLEKELAEKDRIIAEQKLALNEAEKKIKQIDTKPY